MGLGKSNSREVTVLIHSLNCNDYIIDDYFQKLDSYFYISLPLSLPPFSLPNICARANMTIRMSVGLMEFVPVVMDFFSSAKIHKYPSAYMEKFIKNF